VSDLGILIILFAAGILMLVAEIFIPSHGVLSVVGIGFLIAGVVQTFQYAGRTAGLISIFANMVFVPAFAFLAIKYWPKTPIGKRIAPPNPIFTEHDTSVPVAELSRLVGRRGRTVTPLRPVGIGMFDGHRVSCVAEFGMIEAGKAIQATRVSGSSVAVEEVAA